MHWFFMCFSDEGHIRVPTLQNHMLQNNDFTKALINQDFLPDWQRQNQLARIIRLMSYLTLMLMVAGQVVTSQFSTVEDAVNRRSDCHQGCQQAHFPLLACGVQSVHKIEVHGAVYDRLFTYRLPRVAMTAADVSTVVQTSASLADLRAAMEADSGVNATLAEDSSLVASIAEHGVLAPSTFAQLASQLEGAGAKSEDARGMAHELGASLDRHSGFDLASLQANEGGATAGLQSDMTRFESCAVAAAKSPRKVLIPDGSRGQRLQTCFAYCKRSSDTADLGFGLDSRPSCDEAFGHPSYFRDLLCVDPQEAPDVQVAFSDGALPGVPLSMLDVGLAVLAGNALQLLFEMLLLWMTDLSEDVQEVGSSAYKCLGQVAAILCLFLLTLSTVGCFNIATRMGGTSFIWYAFIVSVLMDQVKNVMTQPIIWWLVTRRCGRVAPGIQEYNEEYLLQWDLQESLMDELRRRVAELLQLPVVNLGIIGLIAVYALFTLTQLVLRDILEPEGEAERIFKTIDLAIVVVFTVEIVLKTFAYGGNFWFDKWNFFDSAIVLTSLVAGVVQPGENRSGLGLLRLLRLMRVMLVIRKVSEGRKKLKSIKLKSAVHVGSYVESVLEILEDLQQHKHITPAHLEDLDWAVEMIVSNKLYKVSLATDDEIGEAGGQQAISAWLVQTDLNTPHMGGDGDEGGGGAPAGLGRGSVMHSDLAGVGGRGSKMHSSTMGRAPAASAMGRGGSTMQGSQVDRRQSRRQSRQGKGHGGGDEELHRLLHQVYELCAISPSEETHVEEALAHFDSWGFDGLQVVEMVEMNPLPIVFCKLSATYELTHSLSMDNELLCNFCKHIQDGYTEDVRFHSTSNAISMIQACHYFMLMGRGMHLLEMERFALLSAALVAHCGHPGFTNEFLVKTRHPRALRYNDLAVVQNHTLAYTAGLLLDPENNFMIQWEREQVDWYRQQLVRLVLKLDIQKHFQELGEMNTKIQIDSFPAPDSPEDRSSIMGFALRCADLSWACRPLQLYLRWAECYMEELFLQGDLEKQVGVSVSSFCDRDVVSSDKCQLACSLLIVSPMLSGFAVLFPDLQKEVIDEGVEVNKNHLQMKLSKETGS